MARRDSGEVEGSGFAFRPRKPVILNEVKDPQIPCGTFFAVSRFSFLILDPSPRRTIPT
jgi:hypothetical protein